jgi:hypothetical protein
MDQNIIKVLQDYKLKFTEENVRWDLSKDKDTTHGKFYKNLKILIKILWSMNMKYRSGKEEFTKVRDETNKFLVHLKKLGQDRVCLQNYMATFYKMIMFAEMDDQKSYTVTVKSIDDGINKNPQYTFLILLSCKITFTELWVFIEDNEDRKKLAKIINRLYVYSRIFVLRNKIDLKKYKVPCIEFKTKIEGRFHVLKMFTHDCINETKDVDTKDKENTKKNTDQLLDGLIQCFVNNKIDDERTLLDFESIPFNQNVLDAITDVEKFFKKNKGNYSKRDIALSCVSFLSLCEKFPNEVKNNQELKAIINMFIILIEERMKYSGGTPEGKKIFTKLKKIFHDPGFKVDSGTNSFIKSIAQDPKAIPAFGNLNRKLRRRMKKKFKGKY